jgi:stearoyl-CoA desaturase (delta-9 desaturase)
LYLIGGFGTGAGAHRLWSHRSFKAKLPLKLFIAFAQTLSGQDSIFVWARNHRAHHKFSETNADPHNAKRGFFFAHIGWLMCKKHPDAIRLGKTVDVSDLLQDPIVYYQHKYLDLYN